MITQKQLLEVLQITYPDLEYIDIINSFFYHQDSEKIGKFVNLDDYEEILKSGGMSFEPIFSYDEKDKCVIRCIECGAVIETFNDERYEPEFRCPVCTNYKTNYKYYTKEEIEEDEELQKLIRMYEVMEEELVYEDERQKDSKGLYDWELFKTLRVVAGDYIYYVQFIIDSRKNKNKLKGLNIKITKHLRNTELLVSTKIIPLFKEENKETLSKRLKR